MKKSNRAAGKDLLPARTDTCPLAGCYNNQDLEEKAAAVLAWFLAREFKLRNK